MTFSSQSNEKRKKTDLETEALIRCLQQMEGLTIKEFVTDGHLQIGNFDEILFVKLKE